jgi:hypothetical protein
MMHTGAELVSVVEIIDHHSEIPAEIRSVLHCIVAALFILRTNQVLDQYVTESLMQLPQGEIDQAVDDILRHSQAAGGAA